ncbi:hypothetical protein M436DRAFT_80487 [Aureobasidium namibiae CBS 147.97]|uniref:Uncharacterized protein n=1 Tax=Aureobasidium namibiae CBS 147.97 TaxID=1043004 RepID=A0A074WZ41_9PEZI
MANSNTPSLSRCDPTTSVTKPKDRKPKARKSFWSENSREHDRIGWNTRYAFSDSNETSSEASISSSNVEQDSSDDEDDTCITNDNEQSTKIDTPNESDSCITDKNSISITTTINQTPSSATFVTENNSSSNKCQCHYILKRQLDSYDADIRQQILLEVYNWLNGGEHTCSSLSASVFASSSTSTGIDGINDNGGDDINDSNSGVTLTQQQKNDCYWREVYWANDIQTSDNEENSTQATQVTSTDEDWQDEGVDVLNIEASAEVEWVMVLVFVMVGQLGMVIVAEGIMRWLGV